MTEVKKGRKSWTPASRLTVTGQRPGYVQRWVDKEAGNYQKRRADGWVPVNGVTSPGLKHDHPDLTGDGKPLGSPVEYRDMILCELPEEDYQAHREYYANQTRLQTAGLRRKAEQENAANAKGGLVAGLYGKTIIE